MDNNGVTPRSVVISLISSDINHFKNEVVQCIMEFYKDFDPRKSIEYTSLLNLICLVHDSLNKILENIL